MDPRQSAERGLKPSSGQPRSPTPEVNIMYLMRSTDGHSAGEIALSAVFVAGSESGMRHVLSLASGHASVALNRTEKRFIDDGRKGDAHARSKAVADDDARWLQPKPPPR